MPQSSNLIQRLIFLLCFYIKTTTSCPFNNYEDALIPTDWPEENIDLKIKPTNGISDFSVRIGFWTLFIPQLETYTFLQANHPLSSSSPTEIGQYIMNIQTQSELFLFAFLRFDQTFQTIGHKYIFGTYEYYFQFPIDDYQGRWIFTIINFEFDQLTIEMTSNEKKIIPLNYQEESMIINLGGAGRILEQQNNIYKLDQFRGRISKLIIFQDEILKSSSFQFLQQYCVIPPLFKDEQTFYLIKGFYEFKGDSSFTKQILHTGNKFFVSSWVKFDFTNLIGTATQTILRITTRKNYLSSKQPQDAVLTMRMLILNDAQVVIFYFTLNYQQYPSLQKYKKVNYYMYHEFAYGEQLKELYSLWHFIKFEYRVQSLINKSYGEIKFFNGNISTIQTFPGQTLTNSLYYFYIGSDDFSQLLHASIFDLKFQYNYEGDKLNVYEQCHISCLTCNGPFKSNCTTCDQSSNRLLLDDQSLCLCKKDYAEVGTKDCMKFDEYFKSVVIYESQYQAITQTKCKIGYFMLPQESGQVICIQCPQQSVQTYLCLDCYQNQNTWYQYPICTQDFKSLNLQLNYPYQVFDRNKQDYDVYFLTDQHLLILNSEFQGFCLKPYDSDCFQTKKTHLGFHPFVKCKRNYYKNNGECLFLSPLCLEVDSEGECIKTIDGIYYFNQQFSQCPASCKICYFDNQKQMVLCLVCEENLFLLNGQCKTCGENCKVCNNYYDNILQLSYLKCFQCIDDSKYYLSFDGINCKRNQIKDCLYAFETLKNDLTQNTLDLYFIPRNDQENIITHCGRCSTSVYIVNAQSCNRGWFGNYFYSYALDYCSLEITDEIIQIVQKDMEIGVIGYGDEKLNYVIDSSNHYLCTTRQFPLYQELFSFIQFDGGCSQYNSNCRTCLEGRSKDVFICVECNKGYFVEIATEKCQKCPSELNCISCIQQHKLSQDNWKKKVRLFYKQFIENNEQHSFVQYAQSSNIQDYELICTQCIEGYILYKKICIKACSASCLKCEIINSESVCVQCPKNQQGRLMTVFNKECIDCSANCELCGIQAIEQIQAINPLFSNQKYIQHSYICFQSFSDQEYYYNEDLNQFIDCQEFQACQKEMTIQLNLICSKNDYTQQLAQFDTIDEIRQFSQKNILIDDLVSNSSFQQYENDYFYQYSYQHKITVIKLLITSDHEQICTIQGDGIIEQKFSQNIFFALNVEISLMFKERTQFNIINSLKFLNFKKISLSGLIITFINSPNLKSLIFSSILQQKIYLNNIIYGSKHKSKDKQQIMFTNVSDLQISNFIIQAINLQVQDAFIIINNQLEKQTIKIQNFTLIDSIFKDLYFFYVNLKEADKFSLCNIRLESIFEQTSFLHFIGNLGSGIIEINQAEFKMNITNTQYFLNLKICALLLINNFQVSFSYFKNSSLLLLNNNVKFNQLTIIKNNFDQNSFGIINNNFIQNLNLVYFFNNFLLSENEYHQSSQFIRIIRQNTDISSVEFQNISISSNYDFNIAQDFNLMDFNCSLINLEIDYLIIQNMTIERGYGFSEISIKNSKSIYFFSVNIHQAKKFQFLGMHSSLDCQLKFVHGIHYRESIRIYAAQNLTLKKISITSSQTYNAPIIQFYSEIPLLNKLIVNVFFEDFQVSNNLILLTSAQSKFSLIQIESQQNIQFSLKNGFFSENIMLQYVQDQQLQSALIFYISCSQGQVHLQNSIFQSNVVFNSTDNINYINSKYLSIDNCSFLSNNQFNFSVIQPHLLEKFNVSQLFHIEDFLSIFPILSTTGNGLIIAEIVQLFNTQVYNSQGFNGGGFKFVLQNESLFEVSNVIFYQISNLFNKVEEIGGCISIDTSASQKAQILIKNITAINIFSRSKGGLVYLLSGNCQISAQINNISIQNVFSQQGSIIYAQFSVQAKTNQSISIENLLIEYSREVLSQYFEYYYLTHISFIEEFRLQNNMVLFYIENGDEIQFINIQVKSLFAQSFLFGSNAINTIIQNLNLIDIQFKNQLIQIIPKIEVVNSIIMNQIVIINASVVNQIDEITCNTFNITQLIRILNCPKENEIFTQNILIPFKLQQNQDFGNCYLKNIQSSKNIPSSFLYFQSLSSLTKVFISNSVFSQIICSECQNGLIVFNFFEKNNIRHHLINFQILNSICGILGCLNIQMIESLQNQVLESNNVYNKYLSATEFEITRYICQNNTSHFGTCIYVENAKVRVDDSIFQNNTAYQQGGSIYVKENVEFILTNTTVTNNSAKVGGAIYSNYANTIDYLKLQNVIQQNNAIQFGNDILSLPQQLKVAFGNSNSYLNKVTLLYSYDEQIDQVIVNKYFEQQSNFGQMENFIFLPSGQQIQDYQIFDLKSHKFFPFEKKFRVTAFNRQMEVMQNLSGSFCNINSRLFNYSSPDQNLIFQNNFTNMNVVYFNEETQDYNLDNLSLYINSQLPNEIVLQLEFNCSCIHVPVLNEEFPYEVKNYHNNYKLRLNIKPFPCQIGEIKNSTDNSCLLCNSSLGLYSLKLNQEKCILKDDITTISVALGQLNLREKYWRPYFDSSEIELCQNLPENCKGGLQFGDQTCYQGHIGGLCEQCDLYNLRGDGQYSISEKYSCQSCSNNIQNIIFLILTSLWTLVSIIISVQDSIKIQNQYKNYVNQNDLKIKFSLIQDNSNSSIMLKIFINYFQIISPIVQQLSIPMGLIFSINTLGVPIRAITYSLDCFLVNFMKFDIQYARLIWQLCSPFIFVNMVQTIFLFLILLGLSQYSKGAIVTSTIYIFLYLQPSIIESLVELISYREISGFKWIAANVSQLYLTEKHFLWIKNFVLPFLIIYTVIIPLFLFYKLYKNQNQLFDLKIRQLWGFLYNEFKVSCFFWEIIKIFQKECLVIFLIFYDQEVIFKYLISILILLIYLQLNSIFQPYYQKNFNKQDYHSTNTCICSMLLVSGLQQAEKNNQQEVIVINFVLLFTINFIQICDILFVIVKLVLRENIDQILNFLIAFFQKYIILKTIFCFSKLIQLRQQRVRIKMRFANLKIYLILQARQIIKLKKQKERDNFKNAPLDQYMEHENKFISTLIENQIVTENQKIKNQENDKMA